MSRKNSDIPLLLLVETSTEVCSVALSSGATLLDSRVTKEKRSHASVIAPFIEDILRSNSVTVKDLSAVVVSEGPGSYTGLRVGVSIAKGLCFAGGVPLVSVSSLDLLFNIAKSLPIMEREGVSFVVPMIDARRMEVYCSEYTKDGDRITGPGAIVVEQNSFIHMLSIGKTLFCGDGAIKTKDILKSENALFLHIDSLAEGMIESALDKYKKQEFEDVAYFEPFYLKDFIAGKPGKKLF